MKEILIHREEENGGVLRIENEVLRRQVEKLKTSRDNFIKSYRELAGLSREVLNEYELEDDLDSMKNLREFLWDNSDTEAEIESIGLWRL